MYELYNQKINELISKKEAMAMRIEEFKNSIAEKELEVKTETEKYTEDFMKGLDPDDTTLKLAKEEIKTKKEQLGLILKAFKTDPEMHALGKEVHEEYKALLQKVAEDNQADYEALKTLEATYREAQEAIQTEQDERHRMVRENYVAPRLKVIEYMGVEGRAKDDIEFKANGMLSL